MTSTHELQRLLMSLAVVCPENHSHPIIDQAREYLESYHGLSSNFGVTDGNPKLTPENDDYYHSVWYSL